MSAGGKSKTGVDEDKDTSQINKPNTEDRHTQIVNMQIGVTSTYQTVVVLEYGEPVLAVARWNAWIV